MVIAFCEEMAIHLAHPLVTKGPGIELFVLDPSSADMQSVVETRIP